MLPFASKVIGLGQRLADAADIAQPRLAADLAAAAAPVLGNPPDKPKAPEVEFSMKEVLREEVEIYRQPDHGCLEAC